MSGVCGGLGTAYLIVESTYGDRRHPAEDVAVTLARLINETAATGGVVLVPAFAVGRAHLVLHLVARLRQRGWTPKLLVFLDSPMAITAKKIFCEHKEDHQLTDAQVMRCAPSRRTREPPDDSKAIDQR